MYYYMLYYYLFMILYIIYYIFIHTYKHARTHTYIYMQAGFVGDGMLSASVCGEVFSSPSPNAVLAAIRRYYVLHDFMEILHNLFFK